MGGGGGGYSEADDDGRGYKLRCFDTYLYLRYLRY